jgi:hypothetical protein
MAVPSISVSVTAKWHDGTSKMPEGWICKSPNPDITTGRYETYKAAFEDYKTQLTEIFVDMFEVEPRLLIGDPIISGKSDLFSEETGVFHLNLQVDAVKITWKISVMKPKNRQLSDFVSDMKEQGVDSITISRPGDSRTVDLMEEA